MLCNYQSAMEIHEKDYFEIFFYLPKIVKHQAQATGCSWSKNLHGLPSMNRKWKCHFEVKFLKLDYDAKQRFPLLKLSRLHETSICNIQDTRELDSTDSKQSTFVVWNHDFCSIRATTYGCSWYTPCLVYFQFLSYSQLKFSREKIIVCCPTWSKYLADQFTLLNLSLQYNVTH
jgi:hypothetical protein